MKISDLLRNSHLSILNRQTNTENSSGRMHRAAGKAGNVLILSEIPWVRETVGGVVGDVLGAGYVDQAADVAEAALRISISEPALVLIDATGRNGLPSVRWLHRCHPSIRLVAFAMDEAAQDVAAWIDAGIVGYIGHSSSLKVVVEAVEAELKREPVLRSSPAALAGNAGIVPNRLASAGDGITPILTAREEEVVWLIIDGQSNKEIARSLDISVATVKSHVHNLLAKLGLQRRGMLALRYERRQSAVGGTRSADWVVETVARDASVLRPALLRPGGTPDRKRSIGGYHVKQKGRPDQQPLPPIELSTSLPTAVFETSDQRMGRQ